MLQSDGTHLRMTRCAACPPLTWRRSRTLMAAPPGLPRCVAGRRRRLAAASSAERTCRCIVSRTFWLRHRLVSSLAESCCICMGRGRQLTLSAMAGKAYGKPATLYAEGHSVRPYQHSFDCTRHARWESPRHIIRMVKLFRGLWLVGPCALLVSCCNRGMYVAASVAPAGRTTGRPWRRRLSTAARPPAPTPGSSCRTAAGIVGTPAHAKA